VSRVAISGLRIMAIGFPLFAFGMVLTQSFNGAGDTGTPTRINIGVFWLFEIPLAWWLTRQTALGVHGIFASISVAYSLLALVSWLVFRRGTWRHKAV
jgi:Na+-driven multidrug efflux pump